MTTINLKERQKELKEKYMNIICAEVWKDSKHMQDYARKECAYVVELENGDITTIDKPRIEKNFCFGAGMYATASEEEMNRAEDMVAKSQTDFEYFRKENMKDIDEIIEKLQDKSYKTYKFICYYGQKTGSKLKDFSVCRLCDSPEYNPGRWSRNTDLEELTEDERKSLIAGYEEVKKQFNKRINTYLKKYGLSKVHAWSYICD